VSGAPQDVGGWRACGGSLIAPNGLVSTGHLGLAVFEAYAREAACLWQEGRRPAARLCVRMALEVAAALVAADDWKCAAVGIPRSRSALRSLREFTCQVKFPRYG
jgi:hypothetical protein